MTKTKKTVEAPKSTADWIADIERAAAGADAETRIVKAIAVGEYVRQGDLYVVRIDVLPQGTEETANRQLAPGSTQGSRHIAEGNLKVYNCKDTREVGIGPIVRAGGEWRLSHPEHAHYLLPAGDYQIRFQVDERTKQAVRD